MITIPGHTYTVNVLTAPVDVVAVNIAGNSEVIATFTKTGQHTFRAQTIKTTFSPESNVGLVTRDVEGFNGASNIGADGGGGTGTVDQVFDRESSNAQSGIAIAAALIELESDTVIPNAARLGAAPAPEASNRFEVVHVTTPVTAENGKWYVVDGEVADFELVTVPVGVETKIVFKNATDVDHIAAFLWSSLPTEITRSRCCVISVINFDGDPVAKVEYSY